MQAKLIAKITEKYMLNNMKKTYTISVLFLSSFLFCASFVSAWAETFFRDATYYGDDLHGNSTANGDVFDRDAYSVAICNIPLDQYLYVSDGKKGIVVDANDRPNCSRSADSMDLSPSAFQVFSPLDVGRIANLSVTTIGKSPTNHAKTFLPRDIFAHLGVILTTDIPTVLFAHETREIQGKISP